MTTTVTLLAAAMYIILGRIVMKLGSRWRDLAFALLNLFSVYLFFYWTADSEIQLFRSSLFAAYLVMVLIQYLMLRFFTDRSGWLPWLAFLTPIIFLIGVRYGHVPEMFAFLLPKDHPMLQGHPERPLNASFVGISYLVFRTSYLVLEVRNGLVPRPDFWQYLGFAFFLPTVSVGPISPYSQHLRSFTNPETLDIPVGRALLRLIVGAVKYRFIGPMLNQLTYSGLLLDGHPHHYVDLPVAAVAYYLYLYCNFSGFCDIAIGASGLIGVGVAENFNQPFSARNIKDYWNRWHMTLSLYMRDIVFAPLSKYLVRLFGPARANHAIAVTIMVVFILVGVWHGLGWHYAVFGALHGFGVVSNHYYTIWLKKWLGKEGFAAYNKSRTVYVLAVILTFLYVTACLFVFANDWQAMKDIFSMLRY